MKLPTSKLAVTVVILIIITLVAAFLRLWNFSDGLMFQGDQGRDALIVANIFTASNPVFIGPVTSVGNMYLGPFYYYFMLPFLFLTYPSPLGPAVAVSILGIVTVILLYLLGQELVGKRAALMAAAIGAVASSAVSLSRFSWNPNPAPFVSLIMVWATHRAWSKNPWYWCVVAVCFSLLIQLHYVAILSLGGAGIIWLLQVAKTFSFPPLKRAAQLKKLVFVSLLSVVIVVVSLTPLILFDFKHDGLNRKAFFKLFSQEDILDSSSQLSPVATVTRIIKDSHGRSLHIFYEQLLGKNRTINSLLLIPIIAFFVLHFSRRSVIKPSGETVLAAYLLTGIVGTALYQQSLFDHYIAYLFPLVFLTLGALTAAVSRVTVLGKVVASGFLLLVIGLNVSMAPIEPQTWTISDVERTANTINQRLKPGQKFSLVLLSPSKDLYAQNYRYFLSTTSTPALPPELAYQADILVVINEEKVNNVADLPIYEIVTFSGKKQIEVYTIENGPEILLFGH